MKNLPLAAPNLSEALMDSSMQFVIECTTIGNDVQTMVEKAVAEGADMKALAITLAKYMAVFAIAERRAQQLGVTLVDHVRRKASLQ
jgi:hypothetical protein